MPSISSITVADTYPQAMGAGLAILSQVYNSRGGWFSVKGAAVFLELQYGPQGSGNIWTEEVEVGDGAFAYLDPACTGLRFRNAVAGQVATVTAQIAQGDEPPLSIVALGTITTTGKAPTQTILDVAGAGTYTTPSGCIAVLVEVIGGGGAGGGAAATGASTASAGSGGAGGGYASKLLANPAASYAYTVGAGGAAAAGAGGGNGGASAFGSGPDVQATGGGGGGLGAAVSAGVTYEGSAGAGSVGDVLRSGGAALPGLVVTAVIIINIAGAGGESPLGGGNGRPNPPANNGGAGSDGGGGSGGVNGINAAAKAGGAGGDGLIIVTEFY